MDPFRIITKYNTRRLSETLLSSFLNYFLNPTEDHGLGFTLLRKYCDAVDIIKDEEAFWSCEPTVYVIPEFVLPNFAGRIDSLVIVKQGNNLWLLGTEVKIHDSSSKSDNNMGEIQLVRYYSALQRLQQLDKESWGERFADLLGCTIQKSVFVYLVPSGSRGQSWRREVTYFQAWRDGQSDESISFLICPWSNLVSAKQPENSLSIDKADFSTLTMDDIITDILLNVVQELVPQPDPNALHLLRCIQYAAINEFRYVDAPVYDWKFPTHEDFVAALVESGQQEILDAIRVASGANRLQANPLHTSIGIPVTIPKKLRQNTLFRIRTVSSYYTPSVLSTIELEFPKDIYGDSFSMLERSVRERLNVEGAEVFVPDGLSLRSSTHPDSNENDEQRRSEAWLLCLAKGRDFQSETALTMLRHFVEELRRVRFGVERQTDESGIEIFVPNQGIIE